MKFMFSTLLTFIFFFEAQAQMKPQRVKYHSFGYYFNSMHILFHSLQPSSTSPVQMSADQIISTLDKLVECDYVFGAGFMNYAESAMPIVRSYYSDVCENEVCSGTVMCNYFTGKSRSQLVYNTTPIYFESVICKANSDRSCPDARRCLEEAYVDFVNSNQPGRNQALYSSPIDRNGNEVELNIIQKTSTQR